MSYYELEAQKYAEEKGIIEYDVNGMFMEYWSFYGKSEGWYFVRYDLAAHKEMFRGANIPWTGADSIPKFLLTESGATKYNYLVG